MLNFGLQIKGAVSKGNFKEILSPYNYEIVGKIEIPNAEQQELALANTQKYYNEIMKDMPAWKRAEILYKVSDFIKRDKELLAKTIAAEGGKPLKDAIVEVTRAANTVKMSGDEALNLNGEQISMDRAAGSENHIAFTIKQGLGVVLAISAFNHPLNLICHQVATAFAAGNTVVVKPASQTPLSCLKFCSYFLEAGLDDGVINVLPIPGAETEKWISDERVKFVSFIGSAAVGWKIPKLVARGTGYALEHGGTAVAVVDSTADLDFASSSTLRGGFYHAGQVCVSTQNVFVSEDIFDKFTNMLVEKASKLITGNPSEGNTDVGPIINKNELNRIYTQINDAIKSGAKCHIGNKIIDDTCIAPTILSNTNYDMDVMKKEVFGPLININPYKNIDEIISNCNKTPFSFQNAIYSKNIDLALGFAHKINSKTVVINDSTAFRVDWMPFGGAKESGFKVGGLKYAINDLVEEKLIVIKLHNY